MIPQSEEALLDQSRDLTPRLLQGTGGSLMLRLPGESAPSPKWDQAKLTKQPGSETFIIHALVQ